MKTSCIKTVARLSGLFIALALFAGTVGDAGAQEKGSAKGGARLLMRPDAPPAASNFTPMSCGKCKDEFLTRTDWTARGANKPTVLLAKHLCGGCDTTIATVGHGKLARDVASHKCTSCGSESLACCNIKKGSDTATKGMEKKTFEIAPLK